MSANVRLHDDKVQLISLEEWLNINNYLIGVSKNDFWNNSTRPEPFRTYYLLKNDELIMISYSAKRTNYGMDFEEKLDNILCAKRDGVSEYLLFDKKEKKLNKYLSTHENSKKTVNKINELKKARKLLPKFSVEKIVPHQNEGSFIVDSLYKSNYYELASKYVVLDVETNGLRKASDDLISISIYDPLTGKCYNRLLPLHMQPLVLTTWIHGISSEDLKSATDITQIELNDIIDKFNLNNRVILTYSGGKGDFDSDFFENYCKRQGLKGIENLSYENIKNSLPKASFGYGGQLTKDNICNILGIEGVTQIHSSLNDCVLEWKLFEKLKTHKYFFIDGRLYNYSEKYIAPITYLTKYPKLREISNIKLPTIIGKLSTIFTYHVPKKILNVVKKFATNITGIALENGINSRLKIEKQNNYAFLIKNKRNLEYVGSLKSNIPEVPIIEDNKTGNLIAIEKEDEDLIDDVNKTTQILMENFSCLFDFIKNNIFKEEKIRGQELVISKDRKILAVCDLSSETSVLEIKAYGIQRDDDDTISGSLPLQLFYQSNNRNIFLLSIDFKKHINRNYDEKIDDITVNIYKVDLNKINDDSNVRTYRLNQVDIKVLQCIKNNPKISQQKIANQLKLSKTHLSYIFKNLKSLGYIKRKDNKFWSILRSEGDETTKIIFKNGAIEIYHD